MSRGLSDIQKSILLMIHTRAETTPDGFFHILRQDTKTLLKTQGVEFLFWWSLREAGYYDSSTLEELKVTIRSLIRLERRGLVVRVRCIGDSYPSLVGLTSEGLKIVEGLKKSKFESLLEF